MYMVVVYLFFTFLDTSAKYLLLAGIAPLFAVWMRYALHVVVVLFLLRGWRELWRFRAQSLPLQVLRSGFLFGSTLFNFLALETLQLAEATSIYFFGPMVITRPGFGELAIGHVYVMCAMLSNCFYVIMTRRMSASETPESMILYSALAPVVLLAPTLPFTASLPEDAWHWAILLSVGVYGAVGHWFLIKAYRIATASALAPYPYLQMVWMIAAGWLVFGELPDGWTIGGAAIIVASGLYIVHREHRLRLRKSAAPNAENEELAKKL